MSDICCIVIEENLSDYFDEISFLPKNKLYNILQNNKNHCYISEIDDWTDEYGGNYINECFRELEAVSNAWLKGHNLEQDFITIFDGYRGVYIKKIKE